MSTTTCAAGCGQPIDLAALHLTVVQQLERETAGRIHVQDSTVLQYMHTLCPTPTMDTMGSETRPCPGCARTPGPGLVLAGWRPCSCPARGHSTTWCRPDTGGCGTTRYEPELDEATCPPDQGHAPRTSA